MFRGRLPFTVVTTMGAVLLMPLLAPAGVIHGFIEHYAISPVNNNQYGNWTLAVDGSGSVMDVDGDGKSIALKLESTGTLDFKIKIPVGAKKDLSFSFQAGESTAFFSYVYDDDETFVEDGQGTANVQVNGGGKDFGFILSSTGPSFTVTISDFSAPIPEPSTMALLGVGLAGLGIRQILRRRRARRAVP